MRNANCPILVCSFVAGAAVFTAGCGPGEAEAPPFEGVQGSYIDTYISDTGESEAPRMPGAVIIAAIAQQPDSTWKTYNGSIKADGMIEIPGVPDGGYYLKVEPQGGVPAFYFTTERVLELGQTFGGRPDVTEITSSTDILFTVSGLSPWQNGDSLELYSLGAGAIAFLSFEELVAGTTSIDSLAFDAYDLFPPNLIEGSKGDVAYLTQLVTRDLGGAPYSSIGKVFKPASFSLADGQSTMLSGSFEEVPQESLSLDWKRSAFTALAGAVHPSAALRSSAFYAYAEAGGPTRVTSTVSPSVISLFAAGDVTADLAGDISYGNPFPSSWAVITAADATFGFTVMVPDAEGPRALTGTVSCSAAASPGASLAFAPAMHPVKDINVNGMSTAAAVVGAGLTPEVSWTAPSAGAPPSYRVSVRKINLTGISSSLVASVYTSGTSVVIPKGVMEKDAYYYFRVSASPNAINLASRDDFGGYGCSAEAITDLIQP